MRSDWSSGSGIVAWSGLIVEVAVEPAVASIEESVVVSSVVRHVPASGLERAITTVIGDSLLEVGSVSSTSLLEVGTASSASLVNTIISVDVARHFSAEVVDVGWWSTLLLP